jgi:8-oxo-dGTP pyrophosphatase MutT (NUDIX family)
MRTTRPVLRSFTEQDLRPLRSPEEAERPNEALLRDVDLGDLRRFSEDFGREGEAVLPQSVLAHKTHLAAFISVCRVLGAVVVRYTGTDVLVRSSGRLGRHVPEILTIYIENSFTILENWHNIHVIPEDKVSALEFLQHMELRRIYQERRAGRMARPLAERPVAFAVFRAKNGSGEDCYLFEINKDWRRLNFIGGKQEPQDRGDYLETARREISEELGIGRNRLALTRLNDELLIGYSLSGNVGSLARYPCALFGVRVEGELRARMRDRWLTESTIRRCVDVDDGPLMINPTYVSFLLAGVPSRLSRVPLSTDATVRSTPTGDLLPNGETVTDRWLRVIRTNKDLVAAVLTIVAALIGVILAIK